jgi:hypothetical protein
MMTREEVLSIEDYCAEHKISHKKRLEELEIPFWNFYKAKQKYRREDEQEAQPGQFVQLSSGRHVPQAMPPARTAGKPVKPSGEKSGSYLTIELQTRTGTAMRIQGVMTPAHLRELISSGNVQP